MTQPSFARLFGIVAAAGLIAAGCATSSLRQAQQADELRDYDVAVAQYTRALREQPDSKDAQLGLDRARLRASEAHLGRGRRLFAQGRYEDALGELQIASELNPTNADAERDLRAVRNALRSQLNAPPAGKTHLESVLERARDLRPAGYTIPNVALPGQITTGSQMTTRQVYMMLAKLANLSVTFDAQFRDAAAPASLLTNMTVGQALDLIARSTTTFYKITGPQTITVIPDNQLKRREYANEAVRTFVIQNADLKETMDVLRVVGDARSASPLGSNLIVVRDTEDRMPALARLIAAFDKARPEVVVNVEVLEVDRTRLLDYGVQFASPGSLGIDGAADVNQEGGISLRSLRSLSDADVLLTSVPALYYRLLKTDSRTRTLANPHVRITDGVPATASFGQDVPVPRQTMVPLAQGGVAIQQQTAFDYRTIGVNIGITPRIHPNDDVTLGLTIELSSLGGAGFDGLPTFGKRNVTTTIRLKDGETNILAGLLREDERSERQTIPGLGDVPIFGKLFGRTRKEAQQTDVVVMLTPRIVRVLDMSEEDLRPLSMPRDGVGSGLIEGPATPAPPIIRGNGLPDDVPNVTPTPPASSRPAGAPMPVPAPPPRIIKR